MSVQPKSFVHVKILAFPGGRFDPDEVTRLTGLEPTTAFRIGQTIPGHKKPAGRDYWDFEPVAERTTPLDVQTDKLFVLLSPATRAFKKISKWARVVVHYTTEAQSEPLDFLLSLERLEILAAMRAEILRTAYWWMTPTFTDARCDTCDVRLPCTLEEIRPYVGGYLYAGDLELKYALYGIPDSVAREHIDFRDDTQVSARGAAAELRHNLLVTAIPQIGCLQFASSFTSVRGPKAALIGDLTVSKFLKHLRPHVTDMLRAANRAELVVDLVDRSDAQDASRITLSAKAIRRLVSLRADLRFLFRYRPRPRFDADGVCHACGATISNPAARFE